MEFFQQSTSRGLHNFVTEIQDCKSKDEERGRVDKELSNIRLKFTQSGSLSQQQKRKYVWKMCYIHVLGYDVDFGHVEFIQLMSSTSYQDKSTGYFAISLFLRPEDLRLVDQTVNAIKYDLQSNLNFAIALALNAVTDIPFIKPSDIANDVLRHVQPPADVSAFSNVAAYSAWNNNGMSAPDGNIHEINRACLSKKACLCLAKLLRQDPNCISIDKGLLSKCARFFDCGNIGVIISAMPLIHVLSLTDTQLFTAIVPYIVSLLKSLVLDNRCPNGYIYFRTACPWLVVKCLRLLAIFKVPDESTSKELYTVLNKLMVNNTLEIENINKANSDQGILIEAMNLIIAYGADGIKESNQRLQQQAQVLLLRFIDPKSPPNNRYLGLDALIRLVKAEGPSFVQSNLQSVIESLRDIDISIRKRALYLIFISTDESNSEYVVGELITALSTAEEATKEEIVVKIAILAEKYNTSWKWYVDVMTKVVIVGGDFVAQEVWYRIVQIVIANKDINEYAVNKMVEIVQNKFAHETSIALAAYLLGEFGAEICTQPGKSGYDQFVALYNHFPRVSSSVQCIILTTFIKFVNLFPDTRDAISEIFMRHASSANLEIQQRCCEYQNLQQTSLMEVCLENMAPYNGEKSNSLYALLDGSKEKHIVGNITVSASDPQPPRSDGGDRSSSTSSSGGGGNASKSSSPAAPQTASNLISLLDDDAPAINGSAVGIPREMAPQLHMWVTAALMVPGGQRAILFEDDVLRVSCIADYRVHQGRLGFIFLNKTGTMIKNFQMNLSETPHFAVKVQPPANSINGSEDAKAQVLIDCMRPFADAPTMSLCFNVGQAPYKYDLKIPVFSTSFMEPIVLDKDNFMGRWKAVVGEGLEVQETFASARPITATLITHIKEKAFAAFHIGLATGVDTETSMTGSASFRTGTMSGDGQTTVAVGALLRLEADVNSSRFRITVRAKHPLIAQGLRNAFKQILGSHQ